MTTYIARNIMKARDISLTKGQEKYRVYFINTRLYKKYQEDVNLILETTDMADGSTYADCIVAE